MTDSSYDEDDHSNHDDAQHTHPQHAQHTHSHSAFTQRFGSIKKQFPFKKGTSQRERMTNTEEESAFGHEKSSSFGSIFKNRFQNAAFVNRIRAQSDVLNGANASAQHHVSSPQAALYSLSPKAVAAHSQQGIHAHVGQIQRERRNSLKSSGSRSKSKKSKKKKHHHHKKQKRHKQEAAEAEAEEEEEEYEEEDMIETGKDRAFSVLLNENRALKNEIEVYKRSLDAISVEKEHLETNYDELKSKVSDVTTQLRIMTKRYNKLKNKNEEYKKHFQNTLTIRLSAQQQTITNYHAQLTQIKEKYDILYSEYLDKNNIIKDWESKYHRLAADFDEFMHNHADDHSVAPSATELVTNIKQLKRIIIEKDENLNFLSQIISNMYHNSLPIIQSHIDDEDDDDDDDEDEKSESTESDSSHREIRHHHHHRQQQQQRRIHHEEEEEEDDDDDDDEISHLEEDEIATMKASIYNLNNEDRNKLQIVSQITNLNIPKNNKLEDRSLSGISVDDDGIDERDDDQLLLLPKLTKPKSVAIVPIKLPKLVAKHKKLLQLKAKTPTVSHSVPIKKKRRRSWVMEGGNGAIVITTIDGKQRITNKTTVNVAASDAANKKTMNNNEDKKQSPSKSSTSSSSSSTDTNNNNNNNDIAPSPAPPPPDTSAILLQTPQQSTTPPAAAHSNTSTSNAADDIRNNISDQLSASTEQSQSISPQSKNKQNKYMLNNNHHHHDNNILIQHALNTYSNGDNDDEENDDDEEL